MKKMLSTLMRNMACHDMTFAGLALFVLLLNLPYFLNLVFYRHDTLSYLATFYTTYNNFFYHHEFTQWFPYSAYGVQADFIQTTLLTVVDYFVMGMGSLLRVQEVLVLFKLSLFLEQIIFLMGMYLLSRNLFKQEVTVFFVCACSLGSLVFFDQLFWNFRAFYLLPLIIYYLRLCFQKKDFLYLLIAANIGLLAMAGSAPYYMILTLLIVVVITPFLVFRCFGRWKEFFKNAQVRLPTYLVLVLVFLALFFAYFHICFHSGEHIKIIQRGGRDLASYVVPIQRFLFYGGDIGFEKFISLIQPKVLCTPFSLDLAIYVGFLALFFIGYGIAKVRDPMFYAFAAVVGIIAFFSVGGWVSYILYYFFPGMAYYRHIGLSVSCFKVFLPLMAGFGVDAFLRSSRRQVFLVGVWIVLACLLAGAGAYYLCARQAPEKGILYAYISFVFVLFLTTLLMFKKFDTKVLFKILLAAGICIELLGYQSILIANAHNLVKYWPQGFNRTHKDQFCTQRTDAPLNGRSDELFLRILLLSFYTQSTSYVHFFNAIQWDPEFPILKTDFINAHVARLLESREVDTVSFPITLPPDANLCRALGGGTSSKLRLVSRVSFAENEDDAVLQVKVIKNIDEIIVLNNIPPEIKAQWKNTEEVQNGRVLATAFSSNTLSAIACLPIGATAWLYYADGFHPGWKAFVNGEPTPIFQANVGFKAILLKGGVNKIRFIYRNTPMLFSFYIFIVAGIIFVLICLLAIWKICLRPRPE